MSNTGVLTSKLTEGSGTNGSNIIDIDIQEEEGEEVNEFFDEFFDDEVLDLRQKRKREVRLEQTKKRKFTVGYHHGKLNILPYTYQFPPMTFSQMILNWFLGSVSDNLPPLWTLSSKEVKHLNNGIMMWNMIK